MKIVPGKPSYLILLPNKDVCISGFFKEKDDDIVMTVERGSSDYLEKVHIKMKINGEESKKFAKSTILNAMRIVPDTEALNIKST